MKTNKSRIVYCLLSSSILLPASADVRTRYGAVIASDVSFEGATTVTYQNSSDSRLDDELLMSLDMVAHRRIGKGQLTLYVEASATPQSNGIGLQVPEANGDAASAIDDNGKGRFQVSELNYTCVQTPSCISFGLLDLSAFADLSRLANDESTQFLNNSFINNPTIAFPDYTPGMVIHNDFTDTRPGYTWLIGASHGLGDNPDRSYSELLDVSADGKGVFTLLELYTPISWGLLRAGGWYSSADHPSLYNSRSDLNNHGIYFLLDGATGSIPWSLRLGAANQDVSETARFISIAAERSLGKATLGLALGYSRLSDRLSDPALDDRSELEMYARFILAEGFSLTPSIQVIENSQFDSSESRYDSPIGIVSLRSNYYF